MNDDSRNPEDFIKTLDQQINDLEEVKTFLENGNSIDDINPTFIETYPKLHAGIINQTVKMDALIEYKKEWKQVYLETNGTHDEKKFSADKRVGMKLAKIFLFPQKGTPSYKELERANKALQKKLNKPIEMKSKEELKKTMTLKPL